MTYLEAHYVYGYGCDKPRCEATVEGPELRFCKGLTEYWAEAESKGWTKWAGRSQRHYCPDHFPSPGKGSRMHQIKDSR